MKLFVGLDSGTQSTGAVLVDGATGRVLAALSAAQDILPSEVPGTREQDPADWVRAASDVIAGVLRAGRGFGGWLQHPGRRDAVVLRWHIA